MNITRYARIVLGLSLLLFGLNGFFSFLPIPEKQGFALEFLQTLKKAGYLLPVVAVIMTTSGMLLLLNKGMLVGLLMQLPVSFNIVAFHLFHDRQGLIVAYVMFTMNMFLILKNYKQFKHLWAYNE